MRAVFSWSYQNLTEDNARLFRLCGVHPGQNVDAYAMAAIADSDPRTTRRAMTALVRAHLVEEVRPGRYQLHDLLRAYAAELAMDDDAQGRATAMTRLRAYYLYTARQAGEHITPHESAADRGERPDVEVPSFTGHHDALRWLDDERANLLAAADPDAPHYVTGLAVGLFRYLDMRGHFDDALALHSLAVRTARATGDRLAEAHAERYLGAAHFRMARNEESIPYSTRAMVLYRELGEPRWEGAAVNNLAAAHFSANRFRDTVPLCERSIELLRRSGGTGQLATALGNLGSVYRALGEYEAAARCLAESRTLAERIDKTNALGYIVHAQAFLAKDTGRPEEALDLARDSLAMARANGNRTLEGEATHNLASIHRQLGRHEQALRIEREALEFARTTNDPIVETMALVGLGQLHRDVGETDAAEARYREALAKATTGTRPFEAAQAHDGLGDLRAAVGDQAGAREYWQQALSSYLNLGVPQAAAVRAKLEPEPA